MRSIHQARTSRDTTTASQRPRHLPPPDDDAGTERIELIRFDWRIKAGVQPVMLVTRRRLD